MPMMLVLMASRLLPPLQAAKRGRHLQHPQLCLDAIQTGVERGGAEGLRKVSRGLHPGCSNIASGCLTACPLLTMVQ